VDFQYYHREITFCSFFVGLHSCTLLKVVFEHENTSSMCWDFDALGFLHVVCVVVASRFEGLGLKKELVIFMLSDVIRFISEVPFLFLFSIPLAPIVSLKCCPLFALVPTFALMSCLRMMFVSGGRCVNIELRVELKILNSMLLTGWYIEHNVVSSSPLIFSPLSSTFGKVSSTPMSLPSKFLPASILIISFSLFLCLVEGWQWDDAYSSHNTSSGVCIY
jgi:hypothetical protein